MKLPNGERAIADIRKLREYCLSQNIRVVVTRRACLHPLEFWMPTRKNCGQPCSPPPAMPKLNAVL